MSETTYQAASVINQVLEAVMDLINATNPFATVTRGALPTGVGLTCEIGPSTPETVYMSKNSHVQLDVTLNGKNPDMELLSDTMNNIHSVLTRKKEYPEDPAGNRWQITDIQNANLPALIGRENNNDWLMASALSVNFYWRGD
jgi:hypothetical protein